MSKCWNIMGRRDIYGSEAATQNAQCWRAQEMRTRCPCTSCCIKIILVRKEVSKVSRMVQPYGQNWSWSRRFLGVFLQIWTAQRYWGTTKKILENFRCTFLFLFQETQNEVKQRCIAAEPHHGENWCHVSKDLKNWRCTTEQILLIVAKALPIPL